MPVHVENLCNPFVQGSELGVLTPLGRPALECGAWFLEHWFLQHSTCSRGPAVLVLIHRSIM